ncbi:MAG: tRNA pseudouridine(54/55) synthase Pus10, partial [Desulfurococcales archaeon]|nr:tRNA pseudouridine(54/55) synthase Pus10 [Desulfurococcales archaeon]
SRLSEFFSNRLILQRTPRRVLHRRPDILRKRRVHSVKCRKIMDNVAECLVAADGGLYVKELVSGDGGRTTPSFSEVLGIATECVELDVVHVEHRSLP